MVVASCIKRAYDVSVEVILNNFPSKIAGHMKPSNVLSLLMKKTLLAVLVFLCLVGQWAPVTLIAVDGFGADGATAGQTVTFVLAQDLTLRGRVLARTGDVASGQVGQVSVPKVPGEARSVGLQPVTLRAGNVNVPLRSSQVRGGAEPVQYKELPESGKVEVTLFVAENVQFPEGE
jgi:hypothetical protein